jgi:PBP1b-binding outer membrane lipoprotein LpoB
MKNYILSIITIIILISCSDNIEEASNDNHNIQNKTELFIIPDYIDIKKELIVAAYREVHPQDAYVIIVYNDTTQITATKMSYLNDSIFEVKDLIKIYYNQFRLKNDSTESYTITDSTITLFRKNGIFAMNIEYPRVDIE